MAGRRGAEKSFYEAEKAFSVALKQAYKKGGVDIVNTLNSVNVDLRNLEDGVFAEGIDKSDEDYVHDLTTDMVKLADRALIMHEALLDAKDALDSIPFFNYDDED